MSEREKECVCGRLAKKEKVLKMKRENLGLGDGQCKGLLWRVIDTPLYLSMGPLKQVYCGGSLAHRYSTPQNTRTIVAGQ